MAETHINAYKDELASKEAELVALQSEVDTLKRTIAEKEGVEPEESVEAVEESEVQVPKEKSLADHTRAELNEIAAEAGVENPEGLANKAAVIEAIKEGQE